jgi:hypothetical protein
MVLSGVIRQKEYLMETFFRHKKKEKDLVCAEAIGLLRTFRKGFF